MKEKGFVLCASGDFYKHLISLSELLGRLTYLLVKDLSIISISLPPKEEKSVAQNPRNQAVTDLSKKLIHGTKLYFCNSSLSFLLILCI